MGASGAVLPIAAKAQAMAAIVYGQELGIVANSPDDQTEILQSALDLAASSSMILQLPAGRLVLSGVNLPQNCSVRGTGRATILYSPGGKGIFVARDKKNISLENMTLRGSRMGGTGTRENLLDLENCRNLDISDCLIEESPGNGIWLRSCSGRIMQCDFRNLAQSAIHCQNNDSMQISFNKINDCANGGIRIWRDQNGFDGTIATNNQIANIGSQSGNGQNGNGINIFRADEVVVASNGISNCAFSAIRANSTNNTIINANQCNSSGEVAIFSEFAFSGSVISGNIVDNAAMGISMANLDVGGRMAICSNNIVRNITPFSATNPDTVPVGIFAEADTAIVSNLVENVPGTGIAAGWGPFLRNVIVSNNIVQQTSIGIADSVAPGAGTVKISGNMIVAAANAAIAGMAWQEIISADLAAEAERFANVYVSGNLVSQI